MTRASRDKHSPNDTFGVYRLNSRIATTQTCDVWIAEHTRQRKNHALKVLLPQRSGNGRQIGYLKREYTVGHQLNHASVIRTEDFGIEDGLAYLVMEYFPAPNLKQWMQENRLDRSTLFPNVVKTSAAALQYLHSQGWVHRDVKPDNFLIGANGGTKLIDFTLTRGKRGWLSQLFANKAQGTLTYMSPEQIRKKTQDHRTDIYSFGCVVFELTCGRPPFTGGNPNELLTKHLRSPVPSLRTINPRLTDAFSDVVRHLMAKRPAERPASMDDVIRKLNEIEMFES